MYNDSYQKISDDRLMKCIDYSGMIRDSFRRLGFVTSDSFFFLSVDVRALRDPYYIVKGGGKSEVVSITDCSVYGSTPI